MRIANAASTVAGRAESIVPGSTRCSNIFQNIMSFSLDAKISGILGTTSVVVAAMWAGRSAADSTKVRRVKTFERR
jgi:hypothetical protein